MRPALAALTIGVLVGQVTEASVALPSLGLGALGALLLAWALAGGRPLLVPVGLAVAGLALGGAQMRAVIAPVLPPSHVARLTLPLRTMLTARIVAPPERRGGRTVLLVEAEGIARGGEAVAVTGRVRLAIRHPGRRWRWGERLVAPTTLRRPRNFADPGALDWEGVLARRGVLVTGSVWDGAGVRRLPGRVRGVRAWVERWRRRVAARIRAVVPPREAAVLQALVVGDEGGVEGPLRDAFTRAGVVHVLSVSGLHVALVAAAAFAAMRAMLSMSERLLLAVDVRRVAGVLGLVPVGLYAALAGLGVPTLRSALMAAAGVSAALVGRRADVLRTLTLAALVLALAWPGCPLDVGFQLSFASVLAIVCGARRAGTPAPGAGWRARGRAWLREAVVVSVSALAGTVPLTAFHFHQVSLVAVIANPLVLPLFGAVVVLPGVLGAFVEPLAPAWANVLFAAAGVVLRPAIALVEILGAPAWASIDVPTPTVVELVLCYLPLAALVVRPPRAARVLVAVGLAALLVDAGWWVDERVGRHELRVTFLDVGQGDATVVELPGGHVVVVDAGGFPAGDFDTGAAVVGPFLWSRKILRVDALAMTHAQPDHFGGLAYLLRHQHPAELWWTGVPGRGAAWDGLQTALAASDARVRVLSDDGGVSQGLVGDAAVLHPGAGGDRSLNDSSLTLRVALGDVSVLLTGDVEARAEERLLRTPERLRATVLKVPHHGSRTSSTPAFVDAVAPLVAVIPVGAENRYGHPAPEVERRYRARGTCVLRTDRCGAVTVVTDGRRLDVRAERAGCGCPTLRPPA